MTSRQSGPRERTLQRMSIFMRKPVARTLDEHEHGGGATPPVERAAMVLLSTICAVALIFAESNWRGVWRPSAHTTAEFLQVSRERARRFRRGAHMGWFVLAAEAAVFAPWVWLPAGAQWWPWLFLLAMLVAGASFLIQSARWATRETDLLDALARELTTT